MSKVHLSERFEKLNKLGEGSYGEVYKVFDKQRNQILALKKIKLGEDEEGIPSTALREITLLRELHHKNIVNLCDLIYKFQERKLYLLFEYIDTDLRKFVDSHRESLPPKLVRSIFREIVEGVDYCHENTIFHRDLKPQNILISSCGSKVKIADFGLARHFNIPFRLYSKEIVTLYYRAPEILMGAKNYGIGVDIWSLGCIFAELFTKKPLFMGDCQVQTLFMIFKTLGTPTEATWPGCSDIPDYCEKFPKFRREGFGDLLKISGFNNTCLDLLEKMLCLDPVKRVNCREILAHPYFSFSN